jgi:hypothetical protein
VALSCGHMYNLSVGAAVTSARHVILNFNNKIYVKFKSFTNTTFRCLCNLAGNGHEPREDGAVASRHVGAL